LANVTVNKLLPVSLTGTYSLNIE